MNSASGAGDSRNAGLGNRSKSLGAALKERGMARGLAVAPEIEYELGNGDISDSDPEADVVSEDAPSGRRVVMVYDEHGNATPMPMAKFYYDSVQADESDEEDEDEDEGGAHGQRALEQDTVRTNVPAKFSGRDGNFSDSVSSNCDAVAQKGEDGSAEDGTFVEDAEDAEYEDGDEDGESDPFKNQFMRIQIPAAQLKDVARVKKDVDHNKVQRRRSLRVGLQRAVSTVKIADGGRARAAASIAPPTSRQNSGARSSAGKLVRAMSFSKEMKTDPDNILENVKKVPEVEQAIGLERPRESTATRPAKRQGLGAVGRIMSITKSKGPSKATPGDASLEAKKSDRSRSTELGSPRTLSASQTTTSTANKTGTRAGLSQVGRMLSINRKKSPQVAGSQTTTADKLVGCHHQPEPESIVSNRSVDRERQESKADKHSNAPVRMGLAKMGRMMSLRSRRHTTQHQNDPQGEKSNERDASKKPHFSPVSASTVSSNPVGSPASEGDRQGHDSERSRPSVNSVRKEATRTNLKAAGRLLSFSRKPATSGDGAQRGRTLLVRDDASAERIDMAKRTQSIPPKKGEEGSAAPGAGKKLDGRANKFFYSEINSERVRMSSLLASDTHIRVPVIAMAEYSGPVSRTKWYIDGFTLPHNAVRRECIDLYEILTAMARCKGPGDITGDDINDFEDWWKTANSFFNCYFEMERTILFPWVDAAGTRDWEVQLALKKMRSMKERLQEHLVKVDNVWNLKNSKGPGEMFAFVYKAVDLFVPRLMNYFADQEVLLPAIVKGFYKLEDRLKMDKEMVNTFMGGALTRKTKEEPHHNLILLIRWIGNPRQLRAWIGKNLNSNARAQYGNWYNQYQEHHYRFVKTLRNRSKVMLATGP